MSHLLLAVTPLKNQDIQVLNDADITVVTPDNVQPEQINEIEISYGWSSEIGTKMLTSPTSKLKWVQTMSAGVDYVPLQQLSERQITLTNASGLKSVPIAQSVLSYMLHFARGLNIYQDRQYWEEYTDQYTLAELPTVIFGTGHIGQQIAEYLQSFGTTVYGVNTTGRPVIGFDQTFAINKLTELPDDIQVVINVLPSTPETEAFFDDAVLAQFKQLYLFINAGRGTTVVESALLTALDNQSIRYAALDVTAQEPIPSDSPLWHRPNLLLTQHTTWAAHNAVGRSSNLFPLFMRNVPGYLANQPLTFNVVDLSRGY